jgi:predicted permease
VSVWQKLKNLSPAYRRAQQQDVDEELRALRELAEPSELGNLTRVAEEARSVWGWSFVEELWRDLQYAARTMRNSPSFTATAVLSLALGIGANTAIFSLIDALMLRMLPVERPEELVLVRLSRPGVEPPNVTLSYPIVQALERQGDVFAGVAAFSSMTLIVGPRGSLNRVAGTWVNGGYYGTLGLKAQRGRLLTPEDARQDASLTAVISDAYWQRQYARRPDVVGQSLLINSVPVTIVGVSPRGFLGATVGAAADITLPMSARPRIDPRAARILGPGNFWIRALARLRPGISPERAKARLDAAWVGLADQVLPPTWPAFAKKRMVDSRFGFAPGGTGYTFLRETFRKPLVVLMALVGLVLLIACANVANLLLARAATRQREIAARLALGASRGRLIRQLLTESLALASVGAGLGIALATVAARALVKTQSVDGDLVLDVGPSANVLAFTVAAAIATGILFGLAPALQATAAGPLAGLKDEARRNRSRVLGSLVSVQVALSLLLLVGAGLFVRTLQNLVNRDTGYDRNGVLLVSTDGRPEGYEDDALAAFYRELLERVRAIPGVASASISGNTPLSGSTWAEAAVPKGQPLPEREDTVFIAAGPGYFATMRTPVVQGREFADGDERGPLVAVVNESYARRHFAGRTPVGEYITAGLSRPPSDLQIIGVVKNTSTQDLREEPLPVVYVSYFQKRMVNGAWRFPPQGAELEIRTSGPTAGVEAAVLKMLQPRFSHAPLEVRELEKQVDRTLVREHLMARLASGFGALGLVLASVGLYGLLAYGVVRRTKEIGVRLALGAQPAAVHTMVVAGALRPVVIGLALGLPAAWMASRGVQSLLFGLSPNDPLTMLGSAAALAACGIAVAYFPARRAARVDPMTALRHE